MTKIKFYIFLFLLVSTSIFAQQKRVETAADSTKIKIGSQFNLTLKTSVDTLSRVVFPEARNFGALEVLESYPVDTIKEKDRYQLIKKYGLTQFDTGRYVIPRLQVIINDKAYLTDSIPVEVTKVVVDTLKQKMFDIKPIIDVPPIPTPIWVYLLIALGVIGLGFLIYFLIKKYKKKKKEEELLFASPIEKANSLLKSLENKELWQKGEIKTYYSELTDIARNYIEEAIEIPAMESTTDELLLELRSAIVKKKMNLSQETIDNLTKVLKHADLVKFAKSKPLDFEIADDRNKIEKVITTLDKSIPEPTEEENISDVTKKEKYIKKQRNKKISIAIGIVAFLLVFTGVFFIATKGFTYVKDNLLGHETKELLEGEWIRSGYGSPEVIIETPRVLKRLDNETLPKELMAVLREMQMFSYGSLVDNFYILVSTNTFKEEVELDLTAALNGNIKMWELQGAQNILVKQEDYETPDGVKGLKAYGTMTILNPVTKKSHKAYYELLFFKQDKGLQQIIIVHEEGDTYADQITKRVLNSVEFKKVN